MARSASSATLALAFPLTLALACRAEPPERPRNQALAEASEPGDDREPTEPAQLAPPAEPSDATAQADRAVPSPRPYTPPSTLGAPIETRRADQSRAVYQRPDFGAPLRGRIHRGETFHVYALADDPATSQAGRKRGEPGCDRPWAQVAEGGWVCLEKTEPDERAPKTLPHLGAGDLLPFVYARHPGHDDPSTPALPVYASLAAFNRGDAPVETLPAYGSYAFVREIHNSGKRVLMLATRKVVPAAGLRVFKPSEFAGEVLDAQTIPAGASLAWAVRWKTEVRAAPDPEAASLGTLPYHEPVFVTGPGTPGPDGHTWYPILDQAPPLGADGEPSTAPRQGWLSDDDIRRFVPVAPPEPLLAGQITVDVDLDEQVLSIWRDDQPVFVTLISSGKPGDSTPIGLYRIETKWAFSKMASLGSEEDPYYVDAVPWAMYFDGRYALHAAYWHDRFGHRLSHGCVNLAPRDAKHVFELITPTLPNGWLLVHEHERDPGALVRIRRGDRPLPDHRKPLDAIAPQDPEPS